MSKMNKIAAAFNEAALLYETSGSEHSPEDPTDLSDLVNSFFESGGGGGFDVGTDEATTFCLERDDGDWSDSETVSTTLLGLLQYDQEEDVKKMVKKETEHACETSIGFGLSDDFKRRLMSHLRDRGFDAVNLAAQFEIARPTTSYSSLLRLIPPVFVGKPEELKQIVKLMCKAMRESMKAEDMHLPPWRRSGYMQSKWFGHYKRTINDVPIRPTAERWVESWDLTVALEGNN
ncbi:Detected protein of unknown function [Hibiscus syriacus]|uniref:Uncharacterized protein n=1 Tax=Hibiscus syriacus TaxID=106335 RepID=A0A6A2XDM2_HIBSY|nr:Detected protein of unknown function [Hibiscus syriacus]